MSNDGVNTSWTNKNLALIKAYFELCKPRVMYLAILSAFIGMVLAYRTNPVEIDFVKSLWAILAIFMGAGSAGALNMYLEVEIDAQMSRTSKRPLPSWKVQRKHAFRFAFILGLFAVLFMYIFVNPLSALLLLSTIIFYVIFYTLLLKKNTIYNVVIGGVPGAIPPLIGWASVMNSLSWSIFSFFLIIFLWIPPHSWALALYRIEEYRKVKIPMMPVIKGRQYTIHQMVFYSILMIISSYLPFIFGLCGYLYLISCSILNLYFTYYMFKVYQNIEDKFNHRYDKILFIFSIKYLLILLIVALLN